MEGLDIVNNTRKRKRAPAGAAPFTAKKQKDSNGLPSPKEAGGSMPILKGTSANTAASSGGPASVQGKKGTGTVPHGGIVAVADNGVIQYPTIKKETKNGTRLFVKVPKALKAEPQRPVVTKKEKMKRKRNVEKEKRKVALMQDVEENMQKKAGNNERGEKGGENDAEEGDGDGAADGVKENAAAAGTTTKTKKESAKNIKKRQRNREKKQKQRIAKHILDMKKGSGEEKEGAADTAGAADVVPAAKADGVDTTSNNSKKSSKGATNLTTYGMEAEKVNGALAYLKAWKKKRASWKFQKVRQVYLLKHAYDTEKIPGKYFKILLGYLEDLQGAGRQAMLQEAQQIVKAFEEDGGGYSEAESDAEEEKARAKEQQADYERKVSRAHKIVEVLC